MAIINGTETLLAAIKGDKGESGVGISTIEFVREDENGIVYRINKTDGSFSDFLAPRGADGKDGQDAVVNIVRLI